jgi:hypothetical protein
MFERVGSKRRFGRDQGDPVRDDTGAVATETDRRTTGETVHDERTEVAPVHDERTTTHGRRPAAAGLSHEMLVEHRARQREEFGGINWGSAFFGWLVAIGTAALLTALLSATGAAIGLTETADTAAEQETLTLAGGIALIVVLALAYYCGGYVAGRMSRFDGGRQGLGVWLVGLLITIALAVLAVIAGSEYNVLEQLNLPSLPVGESELRTGGIIASVAAVLLTVLAAMAGGKAGERYHRKVDRVVVTDR